MNEYPDQTDQGEHAEYVETVVIGGGQAGLAVGQELGKRDRQFVILDAYPSVGEAWRRRWDSLLLFTPARYCGLPGMRFPASGGTFITKDEMADYLQSYAERFELPIRTSTRVDRLSRDGDRFPRHGRQQDVRSRQRGGRDGQLPAAQAARIREQARSEHRPAALGRVQGPVAARRWSRARGRRRQFGS